MKKIKNKWSCFFIFLYGVSLYGASTVTIPGISPIVTPTIPKAVNTTTVAPASSINPVNSPVTLGTPIVTPVTTVTTPPAVTPATNSIQTPVVVEPIKAAPVIVPVVQPAAPTITPVVTPPAITPVVTPPAITPVVSTPVIHSSSIGQPINPVMPSVANNTPKTVISFAAEGTKEGKEKHAPIDYAPEEVKNDIQSSTLDTMDLQVSGNWLLKRAWWEKTEDIYEQMKDEIAKVSEKNSFFLEKRNEADRMLDMCYSQLGMEEQDLFNIINYARELLDKAKTQKVADEDDKKITEILAGRERDLEQLKLDVKGIDDINKKLDEALSVFFQQIDICSKYEQKAWDNFKNIARELDDKEARKLYYNTEALFKDVKSIGTYLDHDFTTYFNNLVRSIDEHTKKISSQVNAIKAAGVDFRKEIKRIEQKNSPSVKKEEARKKELEDKKKQEIQKKKEAEEREKKKWYYSIKKIYDSILNAVKNNTQWFSSAVTYIQQGWNSLYTSVKHMFSKSDSAKKIKKDEIKKDEVKKASMQVADPKPHQVAPKTEENKDQSHTQATQQITDQKENTAIEQTSMEPEHVSVPEQAANNNAFVGSQDVNNPLEYYQNNLQVNASNEDVNFYDIQQT